MAAGEKKTIKNNAGSSVKADPSAKRRNVERSVEDIFRKFASKPEAMRRRRKISDDIADIRIEIAEKDIVMPGAVADIQKSGIKKDIRKPGPAKNRIRTFRPVYAAGAVLMVAAAIAFIMIKPPQAPFPDKPAGTETLHKIVRPVSEPRRQSREEQLARPIPEDTRKSEDVEAFLMKWKTAWEHTAGKQGDVETFLSFYADSFTPRGMSKNEWRTEKAQKNGLKEWIRLELRNIRMAAPAADGRVQVSFLLDYRSSNYADETRQTLILKKETGNWKIIELEAVNE